MQQLFVEDEAAVLAEGFYGTALLEAGADGLRLGAEEDSGEVVGENVAKQELCVGIEAAGHDAAI